MTNAAGTPIKYSRTELAVDKYWAPEYARLLAIYGPSKGEPSRSLGYAKLSPPA
jgi:hypothetical protein